MKRQKLPLILFGLFLVIAIFCALFFIKQKTRQTTIVFLRNSLVFNAETAVTKAQHERGLMWRESLPQDSAMLFVFDKDDYLSFWMKNTKIPLDMIFVSSGLRVVDIKKNFQPCVSEPCDEYMSLRPAKYVIEVNAGISDKKDIIIGDEVRFKRE
jgi:uncharacterized membrane protein (UPF0127 family)